MDKVKIVRVAASTILLVACHIIESRMELPVWQLLICYLLPYLLVGYDVIGEALEALFKGRAFNEDLLMFIATGGALSIGFLPGTENEFAEAVFVMLFFQIGEIFEDYAEGNSRRAISHLMDIRPDTALLLKNGEVVETPAAEVKVDDIIVVRPGGKIPLDGKVIEGRSSLNTIALTGESVPRTISAGDNAISGCLNISGLLKIKVEKEFGESTASRIINLVENASQNKSKSETFITKFARIYTPVVVIVALLLAFVPAMLTGDFIANFSTWLSRALTFLVVSCPCALVISIPLTFFGGIGGASKRGVLIKGAAFVDTLSKLSTVVFDKTGALTKGKFEVCAVHPDICTEKELLHMAAHVERFSTHPIAVSLKHAYPDENDGCRVTNVEELAGRGVKANVEGQEVYVGNEKLMESVGAKWRPCHKVGTIVHVAIDGTYAGHIVVSDIIKPDSREAITSLKALGVKKTVMLTGDQQEVGKYVAGEVGIDEYHAELLPDGKLAILERLISSNKHGETLAFVGDGINDAPALARADVGIAMGALGSDAAIEAADVVLMDDKPSKIALAVKIARRTLRIASQNAWFAIGVKVVVLLLAALGFANMWMAVFADVGVTVLAVFNAMRALSVK